MAHVLSSLNPLFKIHTFMKKTTKVQYGCVEISSDFICIGASTGTTYIFDRQTSELKHFITNRTSAIVNLKFSSDGKILAVADSSGLITLWEIPPEIHTRDHLNQEIKVFRELKELVGEKVTELCWHESLNLFIGTQSGTVASFNVGSNVFVSKFEILMKSGSRIVQLDVSFGKLLISSTKKAFIYSLDCIVEGEKKKKSSGQFYQIGKKARDGLYGCCFLNNSESEVMIYSARPGSRLWEVDTSGQVLSTHQFKELLSVPPTPIIISSAVALHVALSESSCTSTNSLSFNFPYLYRIMNKYLLTWSADGIFIFEPHKRKVFAWNDQIKNIINVASFNNSIYVLHSQCIVTEIQLLSIKDFLKTFYDLEEWIKVAEVACKFKEEILINVESFLSIDFYKVQNQLEMEKMQTRCLEEFRNFVKDFEQKHIQICSEIEKKMNQNDPISPCDEEDFDDIQSTKSSNDVVIASKFDSFMEKTTNKIVKKVVSSGFMKKVMHDALEVEDVHSNKSSHESIKKTKSVPTSPTQSRSIISKSSVKSEENILSKIYNQLPDHRSMPDIFSNTTPHDIVHHRIQKKSKKKKSLHNSKQQKSTDFTDSSSTENTSSETSMNFSSESVSSETGESIHGDFITPPFHFETESPIVLLKLPNNYFQIINKLLSVTANTSNNFRDTKILYNINNVKKVLNHWSKELSSVTVEFQEEVFKLLNESIKNAMSDIILSFIDIESRFLLFKQLSAGYSEISNVAMLCLQTSIFPEKCKTLQSYEFALLNFVLDFDTLQKKTQQEAKEILNRKKNDCMNLEMANDKENNVLEKMPSSTDINSTKNISYEFLCLRILVSSSNDSAFENVFIGENKELKENKSLCESFLSDSITECASCILDKCRACFILRYFPILNFEKMYTLLLWKGGCRWRSWCACMVHLNELYKHSNLSKAIAKNQVSVDVLLSSTVEDFLGNVSRLYMIAPHLVSLYIKENQLTNWEVSLLYNTGYLKDTSNEFLLYTENIFLSLNMPKLHPLFLFCCLMNSLSRQPATCDLLCECGKPRPRANSIEWKYQKILIPLFNYLDQLKKDTNNSTLLQGMSILCLKHGYWTGYVKLLVWLNKVNDAISLLVHLQDEEIFMWVAKEGCLTLDLWSILLFECSNQSEVGKHKCEILDGCYPTLNLDKVVRSAALAVGCFAVLEVIKKFSINVSLNLYTSLLQTLSHENQQKIVVEKLLQVANNKVWSDKKNIVHSKLENVKNKELIGIESTFTGEFSEDFIINESDCMWGRNINLSDTTCPLCTLPLCIKTSSTLNGGLILFPCGHIFHKICLPELACLICFYEHFTSLS